MTRPRPPRASTRLEFPIMVSIILILSSMVLPAIQAARDAARKSHCRNNLKQIGLAMHSYHDAHRVFPPGIVAEAWLKPENCAYTAAEGAGLRYSSTTALNLVMPFLESKSEYNTYNVRMGCATLANSTSVAKVNKNLLCPTNPRGSELIGSDYFPVAFAPTDYVLSVGGHALLTCASPLDVGSGSPGFPKSLRPAAGVFNINSSVRLGEIRDGSTNTIMVGEGAGGPEVSHGLPEFGALPPTSVNAAHFVDQGWAQGYLPGVGGKGGYGSVFAATACDAWYDSKGKLGPADGSEKGFTPLRMRTGNLAMMRGTTYQASLPNGIESADPGKPRLPTGAISISPFRSFHAGKCHFLFADGAARMLADTIDPRIFVGLSTVAGDERFDDSAF